MKHKDSFRATATVLGIMLATVTVPQLRAQSEAITVDRVHYSMQSGASTMTSPSMPYSLNFNVRGATMANWGPAFYKPGSGGVPASGPSADTNTGTLNFSTTPNNGTDYLFSHDFSSDAALLATYPVAPTDGGAYGVKFVGSSPPTPAQFTAGLVYAGGAYPTNAPQITGVNNGATWISGTLRINRAGTTTLQLSDFTEYDSGTNSYGAFIGAGIYSGNGVVPPASVEAYYLPTYMPVHHDPKITQVTINGSWLKPGVAHTLDLEYAVIASPPEEANLDSNAHTINVQGLATYRRVTLINVKTIDSSLHADFDRDGMSELLWRNSGTGQIATWGTTSGFHSLGTEGGGWSVVGSGDFDGDGYSEPIWRLSPVGDIATWTSTGTYIPLGREENNWVVASSGDFDGDGRSEVVWRNTANGMLAAWASGGGYIALGVQDATWQVIGSGDFDGDGTSELMWRHVPSNAIAAWTSSGGYVSIGAQDASWQVVGSGDFDGDGTSEAVWSHSGTGALAAWGSTSGYFNLGSAGEGWTIVP